MKDQFWPFAECWDGWRGVRIGSPVVVIWHVASAEGRRWPSAVVQQSLKNLVQAT
ncbi:hypothetical protein NC239_24180 [Streptomyces sp. G3]|uniref:hypothetical protein n=1 Tax=Streptomyces TaxID=1883 RepID=UPI00143047B1|nr:MULTISPECIES: hypothetical protein [Streptomyces]MCM1941306.1 hypothetical protein [Streptomyces sp. G3]MCV2462735.1 hypothetical protein [Streptomyces sp. ICN988]QKW63851.1 hypothetical protein HUT15_26865 [Streptomyces sp. NA03103]WKX21583.1 hypothetical protein Q3Y68_27490 [Streptomyces sp. HUAS CX7]